MFSDIEKFFAGQLEASVYVQVAAYVIIALYVLIFGFPDLRRFSIKRIWAISSVCFSESIRRRVLWIIPLALLGLIFVLYFQQSWDPQEDIRQTTKFCLFTTGLVVVISTIILACSSLPREIESKVIFTVVTKPTTRLEIILGKITGFARMSATILVIMGIFNFAYLHARAWKLQSDAKERLGSNVVEAISKPTLQHYVDAGLLNAKTLAEAQALNIYQYTPSPDSKRRYPSTEGGVVFVPFKMPADTWAVADPDGTQFKGPGMIVNIRVGYDTKPAKPAPNAAPGKPARAWTQPKVSFAVMDPNFNSAIGSELKNTTADIPSPDGSKTLSFAVPSSMVVSGISRLPYFYIAVSYAGGDGEIWVDVDRQNPFCTLDFPVTNSPNLLPVNPLIAPYVFRSREGVSGDQVKGDPTGNSQLAIYHFPKLDISPFEGNQVPLECKIGVEKSGEAGDEEKPTLASVTIFNYQTHTESAPVMVYPENNRWFYTSVPSSAIQGSDFDVRVRCLSEGQWLNVKLNSLLVVQADHNFGWNLLKSTFILWMLSVLVTSIAVCCSTFLSWPIAVVLTTVVLFAHWGVDQLGDSANAGIGRSFVTEFGVKDPATMHVVSDSVEALNKALKQVSAVLPDIDKFAATDFIDHGIDIPNQILLDSLLVLLAFGLPFSALAYIRLKNMEVAP